MAEAEHAVTTTREHILVLGSAGMGKSTLLTQLGYRLSQSGYLTLMHRLSSTPRVQDLASEVVRLLLTIFAVPEHSGGIVVSRDLRAKLERLTATASRSERAASLKSVLDAIYEAGDGRRQIVLLADGLDELAEPDEVVDWLRDLAVVRPDFLRLVISSRPGLVADRIAQSQFRVVILRAWKASEARDYLERVPHSADLDSTLLDAIISFADGHPTALSLLANNIGSRPLRGLLERSPIHLSATLAAALDQVFTRPSSSIPADVTKVWLALALLGPTSVTSLAEAASLTGDRIEELSSEIVALASVLDGGTYALHDWVQEYILGTFFFQREVDVGHLNFGTEAAETDPLLKTLYVDRSATGRILNSEKTIILGDRGAGKSAIFRELTIGTDGAGSMVSTRTIVVSSREPSLFVQHFTSGEASVLLPDQFKAVWLVFGGYLAAIALQRALPNWSPPKRLSRQMHAMLRGLAREKQIAGESPVRRSIARVRASLSTKVKLKIGAIELEPTWTRRNLPFGGFRNQISVMDFLNELDQALTSQDCRLIILFDQIDEAFKYDRSRQEALIQGLFLAEASVASLASVNMAFLLRTDLYEIYDIQEKNKLVSRTLRLQWTRGELIAFLVERVFSNGELSRTKGLVFDSISVPVTRVKASLRVIFPETVEGSRFEDWLFRGLQNGHGHVSARQIVSFLNESRDAALGNSKRSGAPLFTIANVTEAMTRLSKSSYDEVVDDYRVATQFVRNCRAGQIRDFALEGVTKLFGESEGTAAEQVEQLERVGFLERYTTEDAGTMTHRFRIPVLYTRWWG